MARNAAHRVVYDMPEVAYMIDEQSGTVSFKVEGWSYIWYDGGLWLKDEVRDVPLTSIATWKLAIAFACGWHARGKLRELPSSKD